MIIEIDQSGKIEQTNRHTVIAFSNSKKKSIMISASEKKKIQSEFRRIGRPRMFVYQTFNIMIFILLKRYIKKIDRIIIDKEYPGKEKVMKNQIVDLFNKSQIEIDPKLILFKEIGKKSNAHSVGYLAFKKKKADIKITAKEIIRYLKKQKSGTT